MKIEGTEIAQAHAAQAIGSSVSEGPKKDVAPAKGTSSTTVSAPTDSSSQSQGVAQTVQSAPPGGIKAIVAEVNKQLSSVGTKVTMTIDDDADMVIIKVVDTETGEVLKQIPPEDVVKVSKRLQEVIDAYAERAGNALSIFDSVVGGV